MRPFFFAAFCFPAWKEGLEFDGLRFIYGRNNVHGLEM